MVQPTVLTLMRNSRVGIPGTSNTRDLAGYPAMDGRRIRERVLYRGEALADPGPNAIRLAVWREELADLYMSLGLATIIDLRGQEEAALAPSVWARASGARLELIPIDEGAEGDATDYMRQLRAGTLRRFSSDDLANYYSRTVRARAEQLGTALSCIARPGATPVLIHCAAGKDRTGLLIGLLLEVLGVPRDVTAADYALTSVFRPNRVAAYADVLDAAGVAAEDVSAMFNSPAAAINTLLEGIDAEYGSARAFLESHAGVSAETFNQLESALLTT